MKTSTITIWSCCALLLTTVLNSCKKEIQQPKKNSEIITISYPEPYELANIILALTDYGKSDRWEVQKDFEYYREVQDYFTPVQNHPLLDSVNYSRAKWKELLSFRTDAYAFAFDNQNQLYRTTDFYANKGVQPFDDHLSLVNDFVEKSNFRDFFKKHLPYYEKIKKRYAQTQYLNEMRSFLKAEFGDQFSQDQKYEVVVSPFVGRMNCHRTIDSITTADFITLPKYVITDSIQIQPKNIATSVHNLFTEMDHGYVNPTTEHYRELVLENFDAALWDHKSGYNENSEFGVFNEYMTWAVYDIFLTKHFPEYAREVGLYWSYQNDSRGFKYAQAFSQQLLKCYTERKEGQTLKDLYPQLLNWTAEFQKKATKPTVVSPKDSLAAAFSAHTKIPLTFSEPMHASDTLSVFVLDGKNFKKIHQLTKAKNQISWNATKTELVLSIDLPNDRPAYYIQFNWWGAPYPLQSDKGVLIASGRYFKVQKK